MHINRYLNTFGDYLKRRFGETVRKVSLSGGFTCPNRDGTAGRGGCAFCNVSSFAGAAGSAASVTEQISEELNNGPRARGRLFLAYFQAYTGTYAEYRKLKALYGEALAYPGAAGLCVGTRPDCAPDRTLDLLGSYAAAGKEVWLELGLQSASDATLARINRGHTFADYADAARRARQRGIGVCAHLILGLPGEGLAENLATLRLVLGAGADALKLHNLHIVKGSLMAEEYARGEIAVPGLEEYARTAAALIRNTPPEIVFARVSASVRDSSLIAPAWCRQRWPCLDRIGEILAAEGPQGSALGRPFVYDGISLDPRRRPPPAPEKAGSPANAGCPGFPVRI